jgi:hypothetical protein
LTLSFTSSSPSRLFSTCGSKSTLHPNVKLRNTPLQAPATHHPRGNNNPNDGDDDGNGDNSDSDSGIKEQELNGRKGLRDIEEGRRIIV